MKKLIVIIGLVFISMHCLSQTNSKGLRGDSLVIEDAKAMVGCMGGIEIWKQISSLHFIHEWFPINRIDTYVENEILDLTGPRSWVERKSEINFTKRVYSPEGKYWTTKNSVFAYGHKKVTEASLKRAPFNFYHLVKAVAADDSFYELRYGKSDIPYTKRIEFYGPDGKLGGWVILNAKKEPVVKATPEYRYALGPLKRFGNLLVPAWGVYDTGYTRFEMISLKGSNQPPDIKLFLPPSNK